ncbi:hypothetical protein MRX96_032474 [Rhipicephalus microplus]
MMCSRYSVFCFILQIAASLGNHYLYLHAPSKSHLCNAPFKRHDEAFNNSTCAKSSTLWDVPAATWCSPVGWSMISWPNCTRSGDGSDTYLEANGHKSIVADASLQWVRQRHDVQSLQCLLLHFAGRESVPV